MAHKNKGYTVEWEVVDQFGKVLDTFHSKNAAVQDIRRLKLNKRERLAVRKKVI